MTSTRKCWRVFACRHSLNQVLANRLGCNIITPTNRRCPSPACSSLQAFFTNQASLSCPVAFFWPGSPLGSWSRSGWGPRGCQGTRACWSRFLLSWMRLPSRSWRVMQPKVLRPLLCSPLPHSGLPRDSFNILKGHSMKYTVGNSVGYRVLDTLPAQLDAAAVSFVGLQGATPFSVHGPSRFSTIFVSGNRSGSP